VLSRKFALALGAVATAGALAGAMAWPAFAHHAASLMFSPAREVVLTGTVKEFYYRNPHSSIQILVSHSGRNVEWRIVTESPNELKKSGIDEASLQPGERVTVRARRRRPVDRVPGYSMSGKRTAPCSVLTTSGVDSQGHRRQRRAE
jgi:hypothetical protein